MCLEFTAITGANIKRSFSFYNGDGSDHSLSSYTGIRMEIRKRPGSPVVWSATLTDGLIKSGNVLTINKLLPDTVAEGAYYTDIDLTTASGEIITPPYRIKVNILKEITKPAA